METWMIILGLLGAATVLYYKHKPFQRVVKRVPWSFLGTLLGMTSLWFSYRSPAAFNTLIGVPLIADTPSKVWLVVGVVLIGISLMYMLRRR